ncbi:MAG: hypothetical protein IMF20_04950 [Proteobacteria bacterium]|nr:hypothetical protein [Pseudomonadota bacterium]
MRILFSVPYNQDPSIINAYRDRRDHVRDVYLPASPSFFTSGRDSFLTQSGCPDRTSRLARISDPGYDQEVQDIIDVLRPAGIGVDLLLNASCDSGRFVNEREFARLIEYISSFRHLSGVTLTNAYYARQIKEILPYLEIKASVIAGIDTVRKAMYWEAFAKPDVIGVASDVNKSLPLLRNIRRAVHANIQVIVNSGCMHGCPFFSQHYNYLSHVPRSATKKLSSGQPFSYELLCRSIVDAAPWTLLTCQYIAPKNLRYYEGIVDQFKLMDRALPTQEIIGYIDAYIEGTSSRILPYDPEWSFDEPASVFERISTCDRNCASCDWCKTTWYNEIVGKQTR